MKGGRPKGSGGNQREEGNSPKKLPFPTLRGQKRGRAREMGGGSKFRGHFQHDLDHSRVKNPLQHQGGASRHEPEKARNNRITGQKDAHSGKVYKICRDSKNRGFTQKANICSKLADEAVAGEQKRLKSANDP